jgi:hypothetical protein
VSIGIAPAWTMRAIVRSVAILDQLPAMRSVRRLVFSMASTQAGLSQALLWPVRGM